MYRPCRGSASTSSPITTLIFRYWRVGSKIRHETVSNISSLPPEVIDQLRIILKWEQRSSIPMTVSPPAGHCPMDRSPPSSASSANPDSSGFCTVKKPRSGYSLRRHHRPHSFPGVTTHPRQAPVDCHQVRSCRWPRRRARSGWLPRGRTRAFRRVRIARDPTPRLEPVSGPEASGHLVPAPRHPVHPFPRVVGEAASGSRV